MRPRIVVLVLVLSAAWSQAVVSLAADREVKIGPMTEAREVSRYFSLHAHGPTQKF